MAIARFCWAVLVLLLVASASALAQKSPLVVTGPEPLRYNFAIVEPSRCYESGDTISVKSGYKLEVRPSVDRFKWPLEFAIPQHFYFKIQYSLSMKDSLPVADAKQRWSSFGKLLTTADGDFFLETSVIINKLSDP